MDPASKTSCNTSFRRIGEVEAIVRFEPMMVKEEMTGGNRGQGRKKNYPCNIEDIGPSFKINFVF